MKDIISVTDYLEYLDATSHIFFSNVRMEDEFKFFTSLIKNIIKSTSEISEGDKIFVYKYFNIISGAYWDKLNYTLNKLYIFCDRVKFAWYYDYWKTQQFNKMDNILKEEINKYDLKRHLNSPFELSYNKIKESLLKHCEEYLSDYFNEQDFIVYKSKLGIA